MISGPRKLIVGCIVVAVVSFLTVSCDPVGPGFQPNPVSLPALAEGEWTIDSVDLNSALHANLQSRGVRPEVVARRTFLHPVKDEPVILAVYGPESAVSNVVEDPTFGIAGQVATCDSPEAIEYYDQLVAEYEAGGEDYSKTGGEPVVVGFEPVDANARATIIWGYDETALIGPMGPGGLVIISIGTYFGRIYAGTAIHDGTPAGQIDFELGYTPIVGSKYTAADREDNITLQDGQVNLYGGRWWSFSRFQVKAWVDVTAQFMPGWEG